MGKIAEGISARATALVMEDQVSTSEPGEDAGTDVATETTEDAPAEAGSGTQLSDGEATEEAAPVLDEAAQRRALLAEKLETVRAQRAAALAEKEERRLRSRNYRQQAEQELAAARAEREQFEKHNRALKQGTMKEAIAALGRDPKEFFREAQQEAIEADTPEAMRRAIERSFEEKLEARTRALEEKFIQRQEEERAKTQEVAIAARFQADFARTVADPAYSVLREAYDDEDIFSYAEDFRHNPQKMYAAAQQYGVRLTSPTAGFTMREILSVLKAAQDAHDERRKARRDKLSSAGAGLHGKPKVNGTIASSKAESDTENDSASTRTNGARPRLSRTERIEAEIQRLDGRR